MNTSATPAALFGRRALLALILGAVAPAALQAQAEPADRLQVLFLGDDALHRPFERAKGILPVLADNGIDMFYTDDVSALNRENLDRYHALIFYNNQAGLPDAELQALLGFVENGGGLSVIHSASAAFQDSEEYIRLVGGAFKSHAPITAFSVNSVVPDHFVTRGVPNFSVEDEPYVHTKFNPVNTTILQVRPDNGRDEPWTWVRTYGDGRVFYTAWGHDARTWTNEGFQQLVAQGTRWAAGEWALNRQPNEPTPRTARLDVPIPTYVEGAPWNTLGPPVWEAQVALSAEDSKALTTLRPGFSMNLFAEDPMVRRIIDFTWDERGRMWAVETNDYPNTLLPDSVPGSDRILILEDTDGDGRADRSTVFADGLNLATSLMLIDGGLVVAQAPHFFFLRDTDGDDRADEKTLIMTGWPRNDTHGTPSNFRYNIDNRILASVGYNGFRGTVGGVTYGQGDFGQGYFAFTPDGQNLEYLARTNNNTWGVALNEEGQIFGSTANDVASVFVAIPNRYYLATGMREPILPGIYDRSDIYPNREIYQVDQFGRFTSGTAHEIYTARSFPKEYWNSEAFVADPTGKLVGQFDLTPNGSTYAAENQWSFLASRDFWMAPVQVKVGPDGALWVSDFYSMVAQHNPFVEMPGGECCPPGEGNAYETPNRNSENGRIWRITWDEAPASEPMRLDNATGDQLVAALKHENMFWRMMAQRLIVERGSHDVVPAIVGLVNDHTIDEMGLNPGALHGIWTLHGLNAFGNAQALQAMQNALYHPAAGVRKAALQALPRDAATESALFAAGLLPDRNAPGGFNVNSSSATLQDADPSVRLNALLTLFDLPASERIGNAIRDMIILPVNLRDRWIPDAAAIAASRHNQGLALELLQRRHVATDTAYLSGVRTVIQFVTRSLARDNNTTAIVELMTAAATADPFLAQGVFDGIAGNPLGSRPFRTEWRNDRGGWPENAAPTLSAEQRQALASAARSAPAELSDRYTQVATLWGMPALFQ